MCLSCVRRIPPPTPPLPPIENPEAYVKQVLDRNTSCTYLSGFAKIRVETPGKIISTKNIFFIKKPCFIKFETLGPFNQLAAVITADNDTLSVYIPRENRYFKGEAAPENLYRLIGISVSPEWIASAGTGGLPPIDLENAAFECGQDGDHYIIVIRNSNDLSHTMWIDPEKKLIRRYLKRRSGIPLFEQIHKDYTTVGGERLPADITIIMHRYKTTSSISYENLSPKTLPESTFIQSVPENAAVLPLESLFKK